MQFVGGGLIHLTHMFHSLQTYIALQIREEISLTPTFESARMEHSMGRMAHVG